MPILLCTEIFTGCILPRLYETIDRAVTAKLDRSLILVSSEIRHRRPIGPAGPSIRNERTSPLVMND
ncbi:hypothetical protein CWS72_01965 [Telmatospirillum siberiense]|uniref:Uncharacterized protein n=2 Tax=Telmatospirillum siberiense TaxID=382514 RepID=A0A2N3Q1T5_9PROT|nr:hypothetical protein CWS72_01965 [Telmatospirillum siberiense]